MKFFWFLCFLVVSNSVFGADISWEDGGQVLVVRGHLSDEMWGDIRTAVGGDNMSDDDLMHSLKENEIRIRFTECEGTINTPDWFKGFYAYSFVGSCDVYNEKFYWSPEL